MNTENDDLKIWDSAANEYDQLNGSEGDTFRKGIIIPEILKLLGNIKGKKVFDAGCGNGCIAKKLFEMGAIVTASDGSVKLVELAKKNFTNINFVVQDLHQEIPFENESFDAIVCSMVLNDLENPGKCLSEFSRILKKDGRVITVIPHPCFTYPVGVFRKGFWRRLLKKNAVMYITNYEKERKIFIPLHGMKGSTNRYHRKLETYFELFRKAKFDVKNIREPVLGGKKETENIPFVIIFELEKNVQ